MDMGMKGFMWWVMNKKVNTNVGITIFLMVSTILVITDFIVIGYELYSRGYRNNVQSIENNDNNTDIIDIDVSDNDDISFVRTTNVKVRVGSRDSFANVVISGGNLVVTLEGNAQSFTLNGEKAKYVYCDYYQYSDSNVIFVLTESGNVYVNEFRVAGSDISIFNDFSKTNYSNVSELKLVDNDNYGMVDEFGFSDNKKTYVYALVDGELIKLDNQYAM